MSRRERAGRRGDAVVVVLDEREVEALAWVLDDLVRVLREAPPGDPVQTRLFPRAYLDPTEEEAEAEWQSGVHDELVGARVSAVVRVREALDAASTVDGPRGPRRGREVVLDDEQLALWMGVVNDARLAIGTALGVTADSDPSAVAPADPRYELWVIYDWLTALLGSLLYAAGAAGTAEDDDGPPD